MNIKEDILKAGSKSEREFEIPLVDFMDFIDQKVLSNYTTYKIKPTHPTLTKENTFFIDFYKDITPFLSLDIRTFSVKSIYILIDWFEVKGIGENSKIIVSANKINQFIEEMNSSFSYCEYKNNKLSFFYDKQIAIVLENGKSIKFCADDCNGEIQFLI